MGKLVGEAQTEARAGHAELLPAHFIEKLRSVAQENRLAADRVPDHVAEAAQAGEINANLVPVRVQGRVGRSADSHQTLGGGGDQAGVGYVELETLAGLKRLSERNQGLVQLAGVVGVGVDGGHLEGESLILASGAVEANLLPVERGGDLERNAAERALAVVADGDEGADGNLLGRRVEPDVEVEAGEGDGLTLGRLCRGQLAFSGHLRWGQLRLRREGLGGLGRRLAVFAG